MLTPPRLKPIPLNAAKVFESAARLGGFKAAASELNVTPGAVAQQIKSLESWAGVKLFKRLSQGVTLTTKGESLFHDLSPAFDSIGHAANKLRLSEHQTQFRIAALPAIAQFWLSPRLQAVRNIAPELNISITATDRPPNLLREPYDLNIFFSSRHSAANITKICRDKLFPVCSREIGSKIKHPRDLQKVPLLHDSSWNNDWLQWINALDEDISIDLSGPTFSLYSLAVQEAQHGAGILIGHECLIQQYIEDGSLVVPFNEKAVATDNYLIIESIDAIRTGSTVEKIVNALIDQ